MKGLILAGGQGTRLRPLTINTPKPIVPVANSPFLLYQIDLLQSGGIEDIILSLSYQPRKIEDLLKDGTDYGVNIRYAVEASPLGTGGAFKNAESQIDSTTVVFNGDVLTSIDLNRRDRTASRTESRRHYRPDAGGQPFGLWFGRNEPRRLGSAFHRKTRSRRNHLQHHQRRHLCARTIRAAAICLKGEPYSFERGLFPTLLENKERVLSYVVDKYWIDIGTPAQISRSPRRHPVEEICLIAACAKPARPSFAARQVPTSTGNRSSTQTSRSAHGVRIENSVIGKNCKIDEGVQIADSVIWSGNTIDAESSITGCLVGKGCFIGRSASSARVWCSGIRPLLRTFHNSSCK